MKYIILFLLRTYITVVARVPTIMLKLNHNIIILF